MQNRLFEQRCMRHDLNLTERAHPRKRRGAPASWTALDLHRRSHASVTEALILRIDILQKGNLRWVEMKSSVKKPGLKTAWTPERDRSK